MNENRMNELTVNDIIRKINERIQNLVDSDDDINDMIKIIELKKLLNYIEKDEEY